MTGASLNADCWTPFPVSGAGGQRWSQCICISDRFQVMLLLLVVRTLKTAALAVLILQSACKSLGACVLFLLLSRSCDPLQEIEIQ